MHDFFSEEDEVSVEEVTLPDDRDRVEDSEVDVVNVEVMI
jgi:hypothetical protein